jgi:hypothetical protein
MCGRYTLRTPLNVLAEQFLFNIGHVQLAPRYPAKRVAYSRRKGDRIPVKLPLYIPMEG